MTTAHAKAASRPITGALRLVEPRTARPTAVDLGGYVERMTAHCPYLAPSVRLGQTGWTVYRVEGDADTAEADLFAAGVRAAEWVRAGAREPYGSLRCENVVILGEVAGATHEDLMAWPHWVLKHLYGPVGVMVGKFRAGEEETSRAGGRVPAAPVSFLPVRAAVRRRDPAFLGATPDLAAALATGEDDGRDVFDNVPRGWKEIRTWATQLLPPLKPSNG
ncbi:hypothetical protein [Actinacidiphila epipremni]|uniref:Uncharacterized protein n=1 Tax=Actinacidiphila epipremni TaxID=2053013 RepID=A0ABX1A1E2_9ACTN|nr:hypothetical protein [Actinacidiphila epipremni]NJP48399.1 hypothetical protein [Actinacidiphila epipremni]